MRSVGDVMKGQALIIVMLLWIISPVSARTILVVGDSLSAGFGMAPEKGWVHLLQQKLNDENYLLDVVNISTSGDSSSNGLTKLPASLATHLPVVVIIELGANDGLRGLSLKTLENNLQKMITMSQEEGAKVLLLATQLPPNYGPIYLNEYQALYSRLAELNHVVLVPMFLEGVAGNPQFMQGDRLHPNAKAQEKILNNVWPHLQPLLP